MDVEITMLSQLQVLLLEKIEVNCVRFYPKNYYKNVIREIFTLSQQLQIKFSCLN